MTADEARKLSDENSKNPITHNLEDVYYLIKKECEKGGLYISFKGNISETDAKKLIYDGFDVMFNTMKGDIFINIFWQVCGWDEEQRIRKFNA